MSSPFTPSDKINMIESFSTTAVCVLIGAAVGQLGVWLSLGVLTLVTLSFALSVTFLLTPLSGKVKAFARRKAESYYYGT